MIASPSLSRNEDGTANLIFNFLSEDGVNVKRFHNNIYAVNKAYDPSKPTVLLNSHHDTVKAAASYTRNPYNAEIVDGRLYGLGSNDAGASVVSLIRVFLDLYDEDMPYNLLLAITAEEEVGGEKGMRAFLPHVATDGIKIDCAIVGEPTGLQPAVAERGLVVLDCVTKGVTGHAARGEGVNAIYKAIADIEAIRNFHFPKVSEILGDISVNITQINAGWQHNAIPDECKWVVDIRTTDAYTNEETVEIMRKQVKNTDLTPRSTRVRASVIPESHTLVKAAVSLGLIPFVSPTTSDMSLMYDFPSLKIGPGQSSRSHSADEFVLLKEIEDAIPVYHHLLSALYTDSNN
ncbi:MAG: M20/M25/M40 family metallo-hydrolase [Muribaculum sp.]|nr:M20/M25/M40 family metallo-hydrolase [Muribaculum sp.]